MICIPVNPSNRLKINDSHDDIAACDNKSSLSYSVIKVYHSTSYASASPKAIIFGHDISKKSQTFLQGDITCDVSYIHAKKITMIFFINFAFLLDPI